MIDRPSTTLALSTALSTLLDHEQRFAELCERLAESPGADTAPLIRAATALNDIRAEAARVMVRALTDHTTWRLHVDDGALRVERISAPIEREAPDAETVEAPAEPVAPPATPVDLARLRDHLQGGPTWTTPHTPTSPLARLQRPERLRDAAGLQRALADLESVVARINTWTTQPKGLQQQQLSLCVALARHLQAEHQRLGQPAGADKRLAQDFARLNRYSATARPGPVHGLARKHQPQRGTWLADAQARWDALLGPAEAPNPEASLNALIAGIDDDDEAVRERTTAALDAGVSSSDPRLLAALAPRLSALMGDQRPGFATLRKRLKAHLDEARAADDADDASHPLPADWPLLPRTRGLRVLTVGGDTRDRTVERWQQAFQFATVDREEGHQMRRVQGAAERVRHGSVDLLVVLRRFVSHKATNALIGACKEAGVPFVTVDQGYGVNQLRLALERRLG